MTPTSEERREVAARLSDYAQLRNCFQLETFYARLNTILFGDNEVSEVVRPTSEVELLAMVADLIGPTCHLVGTTSEEGLYDGLTIFRHELSCGHTCETVWLEPPAYCDVCGARVVSDDDQR